LRGRGAVLSDGYEDDPRADQGTTSGNQEAPARSKAGKVFTTSHPNDMLAHERRLIRMKNLMDELAKLRR
jgi:hypothetical protein